MRPFQAVVLILSLFKLMPVVSSWEQSIVTVFSSSIDVFLSVRHNARKIQITCHSGVMTPIAHPHTHIVCASANSPRLRRYHVAGSKCFGLFCGDDYDWCDARQALSVTCRTQCLVLLVTMHQLLT